jgi:predicted phosphodiesterase
LTKFVFSPDKHVGFRSIDGKLQPLHDARAIDIMLQFAQDFKPDIFIEGGDNLDCGPVSHWLKNKQRQMKDLDLRKDAKWYQTHVLDEINKIKSIKTKKWMIGNHEGWLTEYADENPGVAGLVDPEYLLDLDGWDVVPEGAHIKLGKLYFVHGDQVGNVKNLADRAVQLYGHTVIFGHFHTYQVSPRHELVGEDSVKMGMSVPGLCNKNPGYMMNRPNQWMKGFAYGYIHDDGTFQIYVPLIIKNKTCIHGKVYKG